MKQSIYINGRFLTQTLSGCQRFAFELTKELSLISNFQVIVLVPPTKLKANYNTEKLFLKVVGKNKTVLWEQIDLPFFLYFNKRPLLINLINTAPVIYNHQIVTIHDMTTFINPRWFSRTFASYYQFLIPLIAKSSFKIITVSENSKKDIIHYLKVPKEKVSILNNGISSSFKYLTISKSEIFEKLKIFEKQYVLAVSSLDPRKNFRRLIEAYQLSKLRIPLVIVGSQGKVFADVGLRNLLTIDKNIIFTGYISDEELIELYRAATCFVYPSFYEGFGIPPLEAMACGCATIVSNTSSLPEVCGEASLYIDPLNVNAIATAIIALVQDEDLRKKLVQKGFEQIKKYSWKHSAQKLADLIEENT